MVPDAEIQVRLDRCKDKKIYLVFDLLERILVTPTCESFARNYLCSAPTRVPQTSTDAAMYFQPTVEKVLKDNIHDSMLVWIVGLLACADIAVEMLDVIEAILTKLNEVGFETTQRSASPFLLQLDGVEKCDHDPERIKSLPRIPEHLTAAELQKFARAISARQGADKLEEVKAKLMRSAMSAFPDPWSLESALGPSMSHSRSIARDSEFYGRHFHGIDFAGVSLKGDESAGTCTRTSQGRPRGFSKYCGRHTIIHLISLSKELKKHECGKLLRWSTNIFEYRYTIKQI
ncbi:Hypothetical protein PHPALM_37118 [Phytophthora palmivora]|uniref:Uncharacterized protein n=1 Tax=Phytophthora palmivora TaxID=4796 RepID=A0A2P4WY81_9STRA|nr:Hypothetical protein PHPALM_37118 [Phytophthora palmivora]